MTIAEQWQEFSKIIELEEAHILQQIEMKRAFYAGNVCMLDIFMDLIQQDPPETARETIQQLHEELGDFAEAVLEGRA